MKNHIEITNAVQSAAPASVWGKGIPGKNGKSTNYYSVEDRKNENEKEKK